MDIIKIFEKDLPRVLPGYEKRPEQEEMAIDVYKALASGEHLMIEAGTGVGKSLGYLIPAVLWALENGERVVIATYTKNLQEQLLKNDIPIVRKLFAEYNLAFSTALIKGRNNFVCLKRLESYSHGFGVNFGAEQQTFLDEELENKRVQLKKLIDELNGNHDGQRDNFSFDVSGIWKEICGDKDLCLKGKCPRKKQCYINNNRIAAHEANIIVVNHALFFSDLALKIDSGNAVLPDFARAIFDEAHHMEDSANSNMAVSVDYRRVKNFITVLTSGNSEVASMIRSDPDYYSTFKELNLKIDQAVTKLFNEVNSFLGNEGFSKRYKRSFIKDNELITLLEKLNRIISLEDFRLALNLSEEGEAELEAFIKAGTNLLKDIKFLLEVEKDSYVFWVERTSSTGSPYLKAAPVEVGNILRENLFSVTPCILTSATLSTGGQFKYMEVRLGAKDFRKKYLRSPYNYEKNCMLYIPKTKISPKHPRYYDYVTEKTRELLAITEGNTFILFTSYKAMNFCYKQLEEWMYDFGLQPLVQVPHGSADFLLKKFKNAEKPVLFGTNSFWEGVDVPGERLSCVIVTKLPFSVPTRPIEEARVELLQQRGKNHFLQYYVPKACIRLKQGFGRLIRSSNDRGIVAILDSRIVTSNYGTYFIKSLPKTAYSESYEEIRSFLQN